MNIPIMDPHNRSSPDVENFYSTLTSSPPFLSPPSPPSHLTPSESFLYSLLSLRCRVTITDGRVYYGEFGCFDRDANIIINEAVWDVEETKRRRKEMETEREKEKDGGKDKNVNNISDDSSGMSHSHPTEAVSILHSSSPSSSLSSSSSASSSHLPPSPIRIGQILVAKKFIHNLEIQRDDYKKLENKNKNHQYYANGSSQSAVTSGSSQSNPMNQ